MILRTEISQHKRLVAVVLLSIAAVLFIALVFLVPPSRMTEPAVKLLTSLVWPFILLLGIIFFRSQMESVFTEIARRIGAGDSVEISSLFKLTAKTLSEKAERIPVPTSGDPVTLENIALLHTSFTPKVKPDFRDSLTYLQIEVIVIAPDSVMDRIASVTYRFEGSYPPTSLEQIRFDRRDRFKVKELANGTSIVRAEVKLRDQEDLILLNRFIDLRPDGPRI